MADSVRKRRFSFALLLGMFLCAAIVSYGVIHNTIQHTVEDQSVVFAEIAAEQITTARSVYAREVAEKLRQDGTGPDVGYAHMPGYVPIPAQFLKMMGLSSSANTANLFRFKPVSKWNLESSQGLDDDFLRWAWPQIEQQDQPSPSGPIAWKPVWRFEQQDNQRVLRYLKADPAAQSSCVGCHNSYETHADIVSRRAAEHVAPGKQWKQHQLLGALSITIPLSRVEALAAVRVRETSMLIFGILFASLALATVFSRRLAKQELQLQQIESDLLHSEQEVKNARELLQAKQEVERAFSELSAYLRAIDQHAIVSVTDRQGRIIQANQKFCEISGYPLEELLGKDHRIINSGIHSREFFTEMWQTISAGHVWSGECCNRNKSGELYWVDSSIVPLKAADGNIDRYISIRLDITERKRAEERMTHLANHDPLTTLPNRYLLRDRFKTELARCRRNHQQTAVIFIDLDKFKPINDMFGHKVGDMLLIEVTRRMSGNVREEDTVSRHGGDEFIILTSCISSRDDVARMANKLLESLLQPYSINGHLFTISASLGIALFPQDGEDMDLLLKHSDIAMYDAKRRGGNTFSFYHPDMHK